MSAALAALLCFATTAQAEPLPAEIDPFLERLDALVKVKDRKALPGALKHLIALHNASKSKAARGKLVSAAGDILRNEQLGSVQQDAADALGRLSDERTAFKQLRRALPSVKDRTVNQLGLRVITAVGYLAPDAGAAPLVTLVAKAEDPNAALHAVRALAGFGYSKHRERVLKDLLQCANSRRPGNTRKGDKVDASIRRLWQQVSEEIVRTLNTLTGQSVADIEGWQALYRKHKKKAGALFKRPR